MNSQQVLRHILAGGINRLGLDVGIISNVDGDIYRVIVCKNDGSGIKDGDIFELSQTYCSDVVLSNRTKYYKDVSAITELLKHPCYLNTQLRAYIGTPIVVRKKIWGTLNYSSLSPRESVYSENEIVFLESQARNVAAILEQQQT